MSILLSPVGALAGGIYGAITAPSSEDVDRATVVIDEVLRNDQKVSSWPIALGSAVVRYGSERTGRSFVAHSADLGLQRPGDHVRYASS